MCSKIIVDNNKKIYLDNCCRYKSCYVPYKCYPKYIVVNDCYPKYVKVDNCFKKYVEVDDCCKKYVEVHKYEKRIYYCKCCDKYKIKKVRIC